MSERRRRKKGQLSRRTRKILLWTRWGIGGVAMLAIWGYALWIGLNVKVAAMFLPAGVIAGICIACALSVPFITMVAMIAAGLSMVDAGILAVLHRCGEAFIAVGALAAAWQALVYFQNRRKIRRDEAGYP
jgi:glucose-6-phosphate-specific signal transduction histidine kinase